MAFPRGRGAPRYQIAIRRCPIRRLRDGGFRLLSGVRLAQRQAGTLVPLDRHQDGNGPLPSFDRDVGVAALYIIEHAPKIVPGCCAVHADLLHVSQATAS
jgi:hypothetical protein